MSRRGGSAAHDDPRRVKRLWLVVEEASHGACAANGKSKPCRPIVLKPPPDLNPRVRHRTARTDASPNDAPQGHYRVSQSICDPGIRARIGCGRGGAWGGGPPGPSPLTPVSLCQTERRGFELAPEITRPVSAWRPGRFHSEALGGAGKRIASTGIEVAPQQSPVKALMYTLPFPAIAPCRSPSSARSPRHPMWL